MQSKLTLCRDRILWWVRRGNRWEKICAGAVILFRPGQFIAEAVGIVLIEIESSHKVPKAGQGLLVQLCRATLMVTA